METNIDDCSGEMLGFVLEQLLENGALDVFYTSIFMKKNRPAYRLSVVCLEEQLDVLQKIIFKQTTTIGIRYRKEQRDEELREEPGKRRDACQREERQGHHQGQFGVGTVKPVVIGRQWPLCTTGRRRHPRTGWRRWSRAHRRCGRGS